MIVQTIFGEIKSEKIKWLNLVATAGGVAYGSCIIRDWHELAPQIYDLCVDEAERNQGVGTQILNTCIRIAKDAKKPSIGLVVAKKNKDAIRLYKRLGFAVVNADETRYWMSIIF